MDVETGPQAALGQLSLEVPAGGPAVGRTDPEQSAGARRDWSTGDRRTASQVRAWLCDSRHQMIIGWTVLGLALVLSSAVAGIPFSEDTVLLWLTAALFVASIGDLRRWRRGVIRDWLPLYAVLIGYALLRGYASHVLWGPFIRPQVALDRFVGAGETPTVRLQRWLFNPNRLHVRDYATWVVYTSHFFVSYIVAAVLWKRDHLRFKRFIALYVGLTFVGYAGYVLYPAMPPWLASDTGYIPPISRIVPVVWNSVGVHEAAALFLHGAKVANDIAAMPSLHAAYPMLLLLFFWPRARSWTRALLVGYALAMAFSLVYLGEHFVVDELAGWCAAAAVYFGGVAPAGLARAEPAPAGATAVAARRWRGRQPVRPERRYPGITGLCLNQRGTGLLHRQLATLRYLLGQHESQGPGRRVPLNDLFSDDLRGEDETPASPDIWATSRTREDVGAGRAAQ